MLLLISTVHKLVSYLQNRTCIQSRWDLERQMSDVIFRQWDRIFRLLFWRSAFGSTSKASIKDMMVHLKAYRKQTHEHSSLSCLRRAVETINKKWKWVSTSDCSSYIVCQKIVSVSKKITGNTNFLNFNTPDLLHLWEFKATISHQSNEVQ